MTAATAVGWMKAFGVKGEAQLPQHVSNRLHTVRHLSSLIAGPGKTGNEAVADQLVDSGPLDLHEILEPFSARRVTGAGPDHRG